MNDNQKKIEMKAFSTGRNVGIAIVFLFLVITFLWREDHVLHTPMHMLIATILNLLFAIAVYKIKGITNVKRFGFGIFIGAIISLISIIAVAIFVLLMICGGLTLDIYKWPTGGT